MADRTSSSFQLSGHKGRLVIIAALFCLGALGVWVLAGAGAQEPDPGGMPDANSPRVTVSHPIVRSIIEWDEYSGRFHATDSVEIRARVSGYLTEIAFRNGERVNTGDLLFRIDPRPFEAALAKVEADLAGAKARYETASKEVKRGEDLIKNATISREVQDRRVRDALLAEAAVLSAEASVADAKLNLDYTELRAPVSGYVSDYRVSIGNLVIADQTLLTTVISHEPIYFEFTISEADFLRYARVGRDHDRVVPIGIKLMDETDFNHEGVVSFIDNRLDPATGTMRVRAILENSDGLFVPEMFARVRVAASDRHDALLVEEGAVLTDQSSRFVWALDAEDKVVQKRVTLGPLIEGWRVIRDGLTADDRVVTKGVQFVQPGLKVMPKLETALPRAGASSLPGTSPLER